MPAGDNALPPPGGNPPSSDPNEVWPNWRTKFLNDFRSAKNATENDGLIGPDLQEPVWINEAAATADDTLDVAKRTHQFALDRIAAAEDRATRLSQTALSLLALALAVTGFQASRLRSAHADWWTWPPMLLVSALAIVCIALAAVQAIGVDRASLVHPPDPKAIAQTSDHDGRRRLEVVQEVHAAKVANWTGRHKLNEFLQARAWLTRGVAGLALLGIYGIGVWTFTSTPATDRTPAPSPAVPAPTSTVPVSTTSTTPSTTIAPTTTP